MSPFPPGCRARFRHVRLLAEGGFGSVHLAQQIDLDRPAAIKLLHADALADREQRLRFENEARVTARLSHPNIVQVLDVGTEGGQSWIAYEYLGGPTLRDRLGEGPLPIGGAVTAAVQIGRALECAHAAGILHRDVKPENVLAAETGAWKVADFGIARFAGPTAARTRAGTILGTPGYIAPECIYGEQASPASDLYALGIVLFELLVGRPPFTATAIAALLQQHLKLAPPPPSSVRPGVPAWLDAVVLHTLAKKPGDRPESAAALLALLEPGLESADEPTQKTIRMRRLSEKRPVVRATGKTVARTEAARENDTRLARRQGALAVLMTAAGLAAGYRLLDRPPAPAPTPERVRIAAAAPPAKPSLPRGFDPRPSLDALTTGMKTFSETAIRKKVVSPTTGQEEKQIANLAALKPLAVRILSDFAGAVREADRRRLTGPDWLAFIETGHTVAETFGHLCCEQVDRDLDRAAAAAEAALATTSPDAFRKAAEGALASGSLIRRSYSAANGQTIAAGMERAQALIESQAALPWAGTGQGLRHRVRLLSFTATAWEKASPEFSASKDGELGRALAARHKILALTQPILARARSNDSVEAVEAMDALRTVFNAAWRTGRSTMSRKADLEAAADTLDALSPFIMSGQIPDAAAHHVVEALVGTNLNCGVYGARPHRLDLKTLLKRSRLRR